MHTQYIGFKKYIEYIHSYIIFIVIIWTLCYKTITWIQGTSMRRHNCVVNQQQKKCTSLQLVNYKPDLTKSSTIDSNYKIAPPI